jgi:hypothetical protein
VAVVITGAAFTTILNACVSLTPFASVTCTVKLNVPVAVGLPEITPVPLFKLNPAGKLPENRLHVSGAVPPVAAKV